MRLSLSRASQPLQHYFHFSWVTVIYSPALASISSSVSLHQLLPTSLLLSACSTFCLMLCASFICTGPYSISSYRMLPRHLDSSATPGSCGAVAVAMCIHTATQKKVKIQNVLAKISKLNKNKGPNRPRAQFLDLSPSQSQITVSTSIAPLAPVLCSAVPSPRTLSCCALPSDCSNKGPNFGTLRSAVSLSPMKSATACCHSCISKSVYSEIRVVAASSIVVGIAPNSVASWASALASICCMDLARDRMGRRISRMTCLATAESASVCCS